jgi:hypothetical protein
MKHRIKRANTARPIFAPVGYFGSLDLWLEYLDELVWHFKNKGKQNE